MNEYEVAVLFDPHLEIDLSKPSAKVEKIFSENKGKVVKDDNWGKKKLAYPIKKHDHAVYVFYTVQLPAENIAKVESALNITDEVIRYLITKPDLKAIARAEAARAAKAKRAAERKAADDEADAEEEKEKE
ncbi:MAG TPA: 30S ribosomal protein S6 [Candidatus Saccharimonadales bacterium]|nr:30S ribosomal protein S6 [Candidatus Saccharimonadales bacterium]